MKNSINTTDAKTAQAHLLNSTSFGGKLGYAMNDKNEVVEILYKNPKLKDIQKLIDAGFQTFIYTFAIRPFTKDQISYRLDLMTNKEVVNAFLEMS